MTDDQLELMREAENSVAAAKTLLLSGYPKYAASRAYFAMFYVAQAFLEGKELTFSKHSAVIAAFGREFAATGQIPTEFHRFLIDAQETRNIADYGSRDAVAPEQAQEQIERAERFLELATQTLGPIPPENA